MDKLFKKSNDKLDRMEKKIFGEESEQEIIVDCVGTCLEYNFKGKKYGLSAEHKGVVSVLQSLQSRGINISFTPDALYYISVHICKEKDKVGRVSVKKGNPNLPMSVDLEELKLIISSLESERDFYSEKIVDMNITLRSKDKHYPSYIKYTDQYLKTIVRDVVLAKKLIERFKKEEKERGKNVD